MTETTREIRRNGGAAAEPRPNGFFVPECDIHETQDALVFELDMLGVKPADVAVELESDVLTIGGKMERTPAGKPLHAEYGVGDFHRRFEIETEIEADAVSAEARDGVLTVRVPKARQLRPRKIEVKAG
jgi:HSP20 family protein